MVSRQLIPSRRGPRATLLAGLAFFSFLLAMARGELTLSPRLEEYDLDGMKMWRLVFQTGSEAEASFRPPDGWEYSGSAQRLGLRPPGKPNAEASIVRLAIENFPPCNESGAKRLSEIALSALPEGAEGIKLDSATASPLQISGKETYLIELSYTFYGERLRRYCLFLGSEWGPMRFQLTCLASDYEKLMPLFQKSLHTWQRL